MSKVFVGCDISFNSPAVTINHENKFVTLFVGDKKKYENFNVDYKNFKFVNIIGNNIKALECIDTNSEERFKQMKFLCEELTKYIIQIKDEKKVIIEQTTFGVGSQGESKLYEQSGIFKYLLHKNNIPFQELSPTTLKKLGTGNGHATKYQAYLVIQNEFPDVPFLEVLLNASGKGKIISPIEDVIDSMMFSLIAAEHKFKKMNIAEDLVSMMLDGKS